MLNEKNVVKLIAALFFVGSSALTYASPEAPEGPHGIEVHDAGSHEVEMREAPDVHAGYEEHEEHEAYEEHDEGHDGYDKNDGHDRDGHDKDKLPTR